MAKPTKQILRGVVLPHEPDRTYVEGMEDELEAAMSPAQLKRLEDTGSLAGDWTARGKESKMASARADKVTPGPRKEKVPDITTVDERAAPPAEKQVNAPHVVHKPK